MRLTLDVASDVFRAAAEAFLHRTVVRFGVIVGTFGLIVSQHRKMPVFGFLEPAERLLAFVTAEAVRLCRIGVLREETILFQPAGFSYEIDYPCTGLLLILVFVVGLLALDGGARQKLRLLAAGTAILSIANLVRLVSLFAIGVYYPRWFAFAHEVVCELAMLSIVFFLWVKWARRASSTLRRASFGFKGDPA